MRARDIAEPYPTVTLSTPVEEAARLLAQERLPGLIVTDGDGRPAAVLPGTRVLRLAVPGYCLDDPALARVVDEAHADVFMRGIAGRTVEECLGEPERDHEIPIVDPGATMLEVAAVMARTRSPLVAVAEPRDAMIGAITLTDLVARVLSGQ